MNKAIYFDLDGTVAALYHVPQWLDKLRAEDTSPYIDAKPMYDMEYLNSLLEKLKEKGYTIGVISWGSKGGSNEYTRKVKVAKRKWVRKYLPAITEFHVVKYGTPKHYVRKIKNSILVDDNQEIRDSWKGETIDATKDIIPELEALAMV